MSESQAPKQLSLKRRINEPPPDALILQRKLKKIGGEFDIHYVRKRRNDEDVEFTLKDDSTAIGPPESVPQAANQQVPEDVRNRRIYRLDHAKSSMLGNRKRGLIDNMFVTSSPQPSPSQQIHLPQTLTSAPHPAFKRPGKSAAISQRRIDSSTFQKPESSLGEPERVNAIADELHEVALEEIARQNQTRVTKKPVPKLSGARSREIHLQRTAARTLPNVEDVDMTDESAEFVVDTYELVLAGGVSGTTEPEEATTWGRVGYLVLSEAEEELWERFLEDAPSDKEFDTDEDDENAEGHYGADYPEDELASDDEYNRDMYRTGRCGGSDDEAWDEDTGTYSDEEYERTMNPWKAKTPAQFAKYLDHSGPDD